MAKKTYKIGQIATIGGRNMVCIPQRTKGAFYRLGYYWTYTDKVKTKVEMSKTDLEYYKKKGETLRKERAWHNKNQPVHISDAYVDDEILIGGRIWGLTRYVEAPAKEKIGGAKAIVGGGATKAKAIVSGGATKIKSGLSGVTGSITKAWWKIAIILVIAAIIILYVFKSLLTAKTEVVTAGVGAAGGKQEKREKWENIV